MKIKQIFQSHSNKPSVILLYHFFFRNSNQTYTIQPTFVRGLNLKPLAYWLPKYIAGYKLCYSGI